MSVGYQLSGSVALGSARVDLCTCRGGKSRTPTSGSARADFHTNAVGKPARHLPLLGPCGFLGLLLFPWVISKGKETVAGRGGALPDRSGTVSNREPS